MQLPQFNVAKDKIKELSKSLMQDKYEKILQDLMELESENPDDMRVKQKIAELLYKLGRIDEAMTHLMAIVDFFEKGEFILKAIKASKNILKIRPELIDYNIKLGALYLKIGMINESANQYRIAITQYAHAGDITNTLKYSKILVKIDPSNDNKIKLAEIYQTAGMATEAMGLYKELAKEARQKKDYEKLLHYYDLLLPHDSKNIALIKDVCILNLRNQRPDSAIRILEQYSQTTNPEFKDLIQKALLMKEALRKKK